MFLVGKLEMGVSRKWDLEVVRTSAPAGRRYLYTGTYDDALTNRTVDYHRTDLQLAKNTVGAGATISNLQLATDSETPGSD